MITSIRDVITEENKGVVRAANRPELVDKRPQGVLFSKVGSTWWRRRRDLRYYKGNKREGDFSHLHDKFADPGDAA